MSLLQCYEVLWIHHIDAICINYTFLCLDGSGSNSTENSNADDEGSGDGGDESSECPAIMIRNVFCEQVTSEGITVLLEESRCNELSGERPVAQQVCTDDLEGEDGDSEPKVFFVLHWQDPRFQEKGIRVTVVSRLSWLDLGLQSRAFKTWKYLWIKQFCQIFARAVLSIAYLS